MDTIRAATARLPHGLNVRPPRPRFGRGWLLLPLVALLIAGTVIGTGIGATIGGTPRGADIRTETSALPPALPASEPGDIASAGNGGIANASVSGGAVSVGDVNRGGNAGNAVAVGDGTGSSASNIAISANGGSAIADASGGDGNLAFVEDSGRGGRNAETFRAGQPAPVFERKVIRNAALALTVEDVDAAVSFAGQAAAGVGGFVFSTQTSYRGEQKVGQIVIHVPAVQFEAVMSQLRATPSLVRIDSESTSSQDVSQEYVDIDARLRNLGATEQGLLVLLNKATNVGDMVKVFNQIANIRGEIEQLQGRKNYLDSVTEYSTITINLAPKTIPATTPEPTGSAFERAVRAAWDSSLALLGGIAIGVVQVVVFLWWLVPAGLVLYVIGRQLLRGRRPATVAVPSAPSTGAPTGA